MQGEKIMPSKVKKKRKTAAQKKREEFIKAKAGRDPFPGEFKEDGPYAVNILQARHKKPVKLDGTELVRPVHRDQNTVRVGFTAVFDSQLATLEPRLVTERLTLQPCGKLTLQGRNSKRKNNVGPTLADKVMGLLSKEHKAEIDRMFGKLYGKKEWRKIVDNNPKIYEWILEHASADKCNFTKKNVHSAVIQWVNLKFKDTGSKYAGVSFLTDDPPLKRPWRVELRLRPGEGGSRSEAAFGGRPATYSTEEIGRAHV